MQDLNDLAYFAAVAEHGGFAAASRALEVPKSKLSRRVALLEQRLGVRLLHRTTRRFAVTEVGMEYLRHCRAMLNEAEEAEALIAERSSEPSGTVRLSCPPTLLHDAVGEILTRFLNAWPKVSLQVQASNRSVDVWRDGVDFALRVRSADATLPADEIVKPLATSPHVLVCAPALLTNAAPPSTPHDLARLPTLGLGNAPEQTVWTLLGPAGEQIEVPHHPRLVVDDMTALLCAALAGVGVAELPLLSAHAALQRGDLQVLLPGWAPPGGLVQAAFASRRGMRPAVRKVLDALAAGFAELTAEGRCLSAP